MKFINKFSLSIFSGVLLAFPWLGFSGLYLFVAFLPLLYIENEISIQSCYTSNFKTLIIFFASFLTWNILTTWWIWNATSIGAIVAIALNSTLMTFVWMLFHKVKLRIGSTFGYLFLVAVWLSFEFLQYQWDLQWPWLTLGNGFANNVILVQWYEFTGVFGGSLWVLTVNILLFNSIKKLQRSVSLKNNVLNILVILTVVLIPIAISISMYYSYSEKSDSIEVVISQPNIDPYNEKFSDMPLDEQYERIFKLVDSLGTSKTLLFIAPETALQKIDETKIEQFDVIKKVRNNVLQKFPNAHFIIGASSFQFYKTEKEASRTARNVGNGKMIYDVYNAALFITPNKNIAKYHKSILVPGVEKMPFRNYIPYVDDMVFNLGGAAGTLGTQSEPTNFVVNNRVTVATPICYESAFGEYIGKFVLKGANLIVIITNDGWWKSTPGYRQHLSYSRLRAIEHRRSIARCANTGISSIIDQRGNIVQQTHWWKYEGLRGELNLNNTMTFYTLHGDYIARFSLTLFCILFFSFLLLKLKEITNRK